MLGKLPIPSFTPSGPSGLRHLIHRKTLFADQNWRAELAGCRFIRQIRGKRRRIWDTGCRVLHLCIVPLPHTVPEVYNSASDGTVNCGLNVMEMTMPQQYIDFAFVKANANFEPVLAHYNLKAKGRGKTRAVLCPFHDERKPSCKIELERKIFHCFGCGAKGQRARIRRPHRGQPEDLRAAAFKLAGICKIPVAPPRGRRRKAARGRAGGAQRPAGTETRGRARNGAERCSCGL